MGAAQDQDDARPGPASPDLSTDKGNAAAGAAVSHAAETIARARGRGRPRKSVDGTPAGASAAAKKQELAAAQERMERALKEIYKPENWEPIVRAPADLMQALTGDKLWEIPPPEIKTLATQTSLMAQYFVQTDPKWIAVFMFSFSVLTVYGSRTMMHLKKLKAEREE